jgi:hypothetical protein
MVQQPHRCALQMPEKNTTENCLNKKYYTLICGFAWHYTNGPKIQENLKLRNLQ